MVARIKPKASASAMANPASRLGELLKEKGLKASAAESCTGGLLSSAITDVAGSSEYFLGAVVAYGNDVKKNILGVAASTLKKHGAVSGQTAKEMAEGARKKLKSDVGVAITGIAGPGGGSAKKPVGTVFIAISGKKAAVVDKFAFKGSRLHVKKRSAAAALSMLIRFLKTAS